MLSTRRCPCERLPIVPSATIFGIFAQGATPCAPASNFAPPTKLHALRERHVLHLWDNEHRRFPNSRPIHPETFANP